MDKPEPKRIAASDLDTYRYYLRNDFNTLDDLRDSLLRLKPPGKPARLGTKFHAALERLVNGEDVDWDEEPLDLSPGLEVALPTVGYQHEVRVKRPIETDDDFYILSGRLDGYDGVLRGIEYKTTTLYANAAFEKYHDSYQWRAYLYCLPEMERVDYHVFRVNTWYPKDEAKPKVVSYSYGPDVRRYPLLESDLREQVAEFAAFVDQHVPEYWTRGRSKR